MPMIDIPALQAKAVKTVVDIQGGKAMPDGSYLLPGGTIARITDRPGMTKGELFKLLCRSPPDDPDHVDSVIIEYRRP